jgi:hypothetical protein
MIKWQKLRKLLTLNSITYKNKILITLGLMVVEFYLYHQTNIKMDTLY